mmetsp:Transcript_20080/g.28860  ORF Transcript_20080/g.28860 Transcript_20080/m.28860 type:complete len:369 (-) Transcript_20080:125-1231(-)|eukprot:CAMPEP_0185034228 /NCGR_PEP_ID=MMETSP1103-20130426/23916_1 /TAXON_ID=36769 /ORGANISM="Paraphysomonas bandaiensis, Strain Caron Lab Isolate" /LENGTH=368 /DNA_ID=CAMNT_0027570801 /DNA_START=95 /DNA_END=1201 /DNA_ORIENTATION=-
MPLPPSRTSSSVELRPASSSGLSRSRNKSVVVVVDPKTEEGEEHAVKNMTLLAPDSIRWMNKRRPLNQAVSKPQHISPHRASQLRDMFDGLDFDGGGEIDLKEFKEAINYVTARSKGPSILGDPKQINQIFVEMDADGSGTVDFDEFVTALTSDSKSGTNSGNELGKLQTTFYEFANMHRRQNILDKISDPKSEDAQRYKEFDRLFGVQYFVDGDEEVSLEEKLGKAALEAQREKRKLRRYYEARNAEVARARAADLLLRSEKGGKPGLHASRNYLEPHTSIRDINELSASYKRRAQYCKRMGAFGIKKQTYVPSLSKSDQSIKHQLTVLKDLKSERSRGNLLPPPISVKQTWDIKQKEFEDGIREEY